MNYIYIYNTTNEYMGLSVNYLNIEEHEHINCFILSAISLRVNYRTSIML